VRACWSAAVLSMVEVFVEPAGMERSIEETSWSEWLRCRRPWWGVEQG
jgi:hypothetical protein